MRVPWNDKVTIKRVLDIGAQSLLVPYVQDVEEARAAVAAPPSPPEVDRRLRAEVADVLGDRKPTFEDLARLVYTKQVIQEVLRLYPPACKQSEWR